MFRVHKIDLITVKKICNVRKHFVTRYTTHNDSDKLQSHLIL